MVSKLKINPCLWFDTQAEEAARFYVSIFKESAMGDIAYYGKAGQEQHHMPEGTVLMVEFILEGQQFLAINAGPSIKFNEAVSLVINCDNQEELDEYWEKLTAGGETNAQQCGWLKDKFGVSWQVTPTILPEMMKDPDKERAARVMLAMMKMKKIDIAVLQKAYDGA